MPAGPAESGAPTLTTSRGAPRVRAYFDEATNSVSYLVSDPSTGDAAIIDPVLGFDAASGRVDSESADRIIADAAGQRIVRVLETHAHADHLSAADHIRTRTGAQVAIGAGIHEVQEAFAERLGVTDLAATDFDRLLEDGDVLDLGELRIEVIATPGHTPACVCYRIGDAAFVGDTLFMPDYGTARCDFPGGDARQLYRSMQRILSLPRETRLFMCHDYKAPGRDSFAWETTVGEQIDRNVHIGGGVGEEAFVAMRQARDATLNVPKLLYSAIQVNIRGGRLPSPEGNGARYVRIPLTID